VEKLQEDGSSVITNIRILYFVSVSPMILYAAYTAGLPWTVAADYDKDSLCFTYWVVLFTPFASAVSLLDLREKCRRVIFFWRRRRVAGPQILPMSRPNIPRTAPVVPTMY
jgi:hypothetical protein